MAQRHFEVHKTSPPRICCRLNNVPMVTAPTVQPSKDLIVHAPTTRFFQILNPIDITICILVARQHVDSTWKRLMEISSQQSNNDGLTYGVDGLAPHISTMLKFQPRNSYRLCVGPSEVATAVCKKLATKGMVPKACVRNRLAC